MEWRRFKGSLVTALVAGLLAVAALALPSVAQAFGVAQTCTIPTVGTNTAPDRPCWVAGIYKDDYTGTDDTDYYTQAGGHPFVAAIDFTLTGTSGATDPNVAKVRVDIPPGLISNPRAVPQCDQATPSQCPAASQLGVVRLDASVAGVPEQLGASVYNMVPPAGKVADYAFTVPALGNRIDIIGGIRSGVEQLGGEPGLSDDDGLYFTIDVPSLPADLVGSTLYFWGVPGDSAHAPDLGWSCVSLSSVTGCTPPASAADRSPSGTPFLTLPSGCVPAGLVGTLSVTDTAGDTAQVSGKTPVPATGCADVRFAPTVTVTPQSTDADTPTGVRVDVHVDQDQDPGGLASSTLDTATVTLPPGMTLDPSAAHGLGTCSAEQFAAVSDAPPTCPAAAKVGTVQIDTPLLPGPLTGSVYLGCSGVSAQTPCTPDPAGGVAASLYVYAAAPAQGIEQKLVGTVTTSAVTGQVTTTFARLPQLPFSDFVLDLDGGPTAPLANPPQCGRATTTTSLTPYSGAAAAHPGSSFTVGACASSFSPGFSVAADTTAAGAFDAPLTFDFTRADRQQPLGRIAVTLPPGLLGMLASVPPCPEPQASTGGCPAGSRIGAVTVLAGAGSSPISQLGSVYLTGPYGGAPFGLSIVVPAVAGPFDLGQVVVRAAIDLDRSDAHVTISSDPLPQIVGGVPLRIRELRVAIDRPGFIVNPTGCAPAAIAATIGSAAGARATAQSRFTASGCGALGFSPALAVAFGGRRQTSVGTHPRLTATLSSRPGQANVRSAKVTLPRSIALDPDNSEHVCSVAAAATDSCPAATAVGTATVTTPLLERPLTGTVYLVQGIRVDAQGQQVRTLPALLIPLRGQVAIDLHGQTSVDARQRLVTTFAAVPDAPIKSFVLRIDGGRRGILVVTGHTSLCHGPQTAPAVFAGHNGASADATVSIAVPCAAKATVKRVRVLGQGVRVSVRVPAAGRLTLAAAGFASVHRSVAKPRLVTVALRLTHAGRKRLSHRRKLRTRVKLTYVPHGWPAQTATTRRLTIR